MSGHPCLRRRPFLLVKTFVPENKEVSPYSGILITPLWVDTRSPSYSRWDRSWDLRVKPDIFSREGGRGISMMEENAWTWKELRDAVFPARRRICYLTNVDVPPIPEAWLRHCNRQSHSIKIKQNWLSILYLIMTIKLHNTHSTVQ